MILYIIEKGFFFTSFKILRNLIPFSDLFIMSKEKSLIKIKIESFKE